MRSSYFTGILLILCAWFIIFPDLALSRSLSNHSGSVNTTNSSSTNFTLPSRRHVGRNRRPLVRTRERGSIELTQSPTNKKLIRLFCRVGFFLHVNENGSVSGSFNQNSNYVKFELQSFGPSIVRIRSIETGLFIAMDSTGMLHAKKEPTEECLFYQNHEENLFVSFASFKYYMRVHYDMFISLKRSGDFKQATSTLPGQDAIQFLPLNFMTWELVDSDFSR